MPDSGSISRQFYVPGAIYGESTNGNQVVDFQVRESRFNFKTATDLEGHQLTSFIELDFMTHADGNERISNSYSPRLRHAFIKYDNWTVGQTWTTFQNPAALPENLDFVGAAEGAVFARQTMIRYTHNRFQIALENPETTLTPNGGGARITSGSGILPDIVARYNLQLDAGAKFTLAGIIRQLNLEQENFNTQTLGYGASATGIIPVGTDDIKFSATVGDGIGRYLALNYVNDGVLDNNGEIETIKTYAGYMAYRHWWNEQWRSSVTLSGLKADNDVKLTGNEVNEDAYSGYLNLLYSPVKPLALGIEYMYAKNTKNNGDKGELNRIMLSMKYVI